MGMIARSTGFESANLDEKDPYTLVSPAKIIRYRSGFNEKGGIKKKKKKPGCYFSPPMNIRVRVRAAQCLTCKALTFTASHPARLTPSQFHELPCSASLGESPNFGHYRR